MDDIKEDIVSEPALDTACEYLTTTRVSEESVEILSSAEPLPMDVEPQINLKFNTDLSNVTPSLAEYSEEQGSPVATVNMPHATTAQEPPSPCKEEDFTVPLPAPAIHEPLFDEIQFVSHKVTMVETLVQNLSAQMADLDVCFEKNTKHLDFQEKVIDRMHEELGRYKEDLYLQLVRPILVDIIQIRDSIINNANIYSQKPQGEQSIPNKMFADYAFDMEDILDKNNVTIYQSNIGEDFVPLRQRVIKKMKTDQQELHGKVAECLSNGYEYENRVISPEKVAIYLFEKKIDPVMEEKGDKNG